MNILAILAAGVAYFLIGFLAHGPIFGKLWMRLAGITPTGKEKFSDMYGQMFWNLIADFVAAYVLSGLIWVGSNYIFLSQMSWSKGVIVAFFMWLFLSAHSIIEVIWMGRKMKHWLFEALTSLVGLAVMGALLASW